MKRLLCARARRNSPHLEKMMAQETTLKTSRMTRTALATRPLVSIRPEISPPMAEASKAKETFMRRTALDFRYWHYKHLTQAGLRIGGPWGSFGSN